MYEARRLVKATIVMEAGYEPAIEGLSYNFDVDKSPYTRTKGAALKLADVDLGENKFLESIELWVRVTAPRYFWQEADTYRHATKQSQSTRKAVMLRSKFDQNHFCTNVSDDLLNELNARIAANDWTGLKRILPESFLQKRMWHFNYKTLRNLILQRENHPLPEWQIFLIQVRAHVLHPELLPGDTVKMLHTLTTKISKEPGIAKSIEYDKLYNWFARTLACQEVNLDGSDTQC